MSASTVITWGYGTFGTKSLVVTEGYSIKAAPISSVLKIIMIDGELFMFVKGILYERL